MAWNASRAGALDLVERDCPRQAPRSDSDFSYSRPLFSAFLIASTMKFCMDGGWFLTAV